MEQLAPNYFVAGIPTEEFRFFAAPEWAGRQRQANWCWAAAVQMVLNYHGLRVQQEEVVQRIFGAQVDAPATPQAVLAALSGWAPDARGLYSAIHATPYVLRGSDIVRDVDQRRPLIAGLRAPTGIGHICVVTAVYYTVDALNEPIFDKVVLRDPWPGSPSRQEVPWRQFADRADFTVRVWVEPV